MIVTEIYVENGVQFTKTYSDRGVLIHGGEPEDDYVEANDPTEFGRTYTETDIPIEDDATAEEIVDILTGELE